MSAKKTDLFSNYIPVTETGCWIWLGAWGSKGYGRFCDYPRTKNEQAHRELYRHFVGEPGDLYVLHKCDTRPCVNPDHLYLGTAKDNIRDCMRRGRMNPVKGSRASWSKLTEADVVAIRDSSLSTRELAIAYGVSLTVIKFAKRRKTWRHVQ